MQQYKPYLMLAALFVGFNLILFISMQLGQSRGNSRCQNTILSEAPSPDGTWVAYVYDRRCGRKDRSMQATLLPAATPLTTQIGNILATDENAAIDSLSIAWQSADSLDIGVSAEASLERQASSIEGVEITYSIRVRTN